MRTAERRAEWRRSLAVLVPALALAVVGQAQPSWAQTPDISVDDRVRLLYMTDGSGASAEGSVSLLTEDTVVVSTGPQERATIAWRDLHTLAVEVEHRAWREAAVLGGLTGGVLGLLGGVLDCYASIFGGQSCEVARPAAVGAGVGVIVGAVVGTTLRYRTWELVPLPSGGGGAGASFGVGVSWGR
jgi:hypothetical protein